MGAKAGADIVVVLASADNSTILEAIRAAKKYGVKIMADLISCNDPVARSIELEKLGVDYINVHAGIDQQMEGHDSLAIMKKVVEQVSIPVAVAGGPGCKFILGSCGLWREHCDSWREYCPLVQCDCFSKGYPAKCGFSFCCTCIEKFT